MATVFLFTTYCCVLCSIPVTGCCASTLTGIMHLNDVLSFSLEYTKYFRNLCFLSLSCLIFDVLENIIRSLWTLTSVFPESTAGFRSVTGVLYCKCSQEIHVSVLEYYRPQKNTTSVEDRTWCLPLFLRHLFVCCLFFQVATAKWKCALKFYFIFWNDEMSWNVCSCDEWH